MAALLPSGSIKEAKIVLEDDGNFASKLEPTFFDGWPRTLGFVWSSLSRGFADRCFLLDSFVLSNLQMHVAP